MSEEQPTAYVFPILSPEPGESLEAFLARAAEKHHWPSKTRGLDMPLLEDLLRTVESSEEEAARRGAHVLRALSFAADSAMALRHLDHYLRGFGEEAGKELDRICKNSEHLHFLVSLFSFSSYLSEIVIAHPDYLGWIFRSSRLNREKSLERYREQVAELLEGIAGLEERRASLTLYKKRELLRIGVREIREMAGAQELCRELSNLAQSIIEAAYRDCYGELTAMHGNPLSEEFGDRTGYCIYAMGKFGAGELNFSSDVDLVFLYDEEGKTEGVPEGLDGQPVRRLSNHDFFNKLSRNFITYLNDRNPEGFLFRIDARLRPEGSRGPLARSRPAYAAYLATQAAAWEKIAYMKARFVVGDADLAAVFDQIIELFVYGNNLAEELWPEIGRLKRRIDHERLSAEERELDIKRGRGGIREIEFIVGGLQIIHGLRRPEIRRRGTLDAMKGLVESGFMDGEVATKLEHAYLLFRRIEHTLQMMHERQTHTMPSEPLERERLGLRCGFLKVEDFEQTLEDFRSFVRERFEEQYSLNEPTDRATLLDYLLEEENPPKEALRELEPAGLGDVEGYRALQKLAVGTREYAPSARGQRGFRDLLPRLLEELPHTALPRQAVHHFDLLLRSAKGFSWVYDLCLSHPPILKLILRTLGFGSLLARQLIAHPEWLDEIFHGDGLKAERLDRVIPELHHGLKHVGFEEGLRRVRQFKQLETFLIGTQEVIATAPSNEAAQRTARIAEASLQAVADLAAREVAELEPDEGLPGRWAILGLGGLGDRQVHQTGDLDVALVLEKDEDWRGERLSQWLERVGRRIIHHMGAVSPEGQLWKIDARLRPEGKQGPLAATRERYLEYYREEAGLWEWQVVTKGRPVAGDLDFGAEVMESLYALYGETGPPDNLAREVYTMRQRIENNTKVPRNALVDLKSSAGGVVTVEFLVQYLQLSHPEQAARTFSMTTEEALAFFAERGALEKGKADFLMKHLRLLRVAQRHHRLLRETSKDLYPADKERQEALHRGMKDQLVLQGLERPQNLLKEMGRARGIFEEFFQQRM